MEIQTLLDDAFKSGIRDPIKWMRSRGLQMFHWLKGAFPRGILPSDCDGEVEINGQFLRLEFKHDELVRKNMIPKGQARQFQALVKTGVFTVFIVGHDDKGKPTCLRVMRMTDGETREDYLEECDTGKLKSLAANWSNKAKNL